MPPSMPGLWWYARLTEQHTVPQAETAARAGYGAVVAEDVRMVFRKYDGALHWHRTLRRLGEDEHGTWLGAPAGGTTRKGNEPPVPVGHDQVLLIPPRGGWTARFNGEPHHTEVYCDLTTVAAWPTPGEVTMVDLDLDVCRMRADGSVHLLDEDEFAEHQRRYGYPQDLIAAATRTAAWLQVVLGDGTEPFATGYRRWLAKVR